MKPKVQNRKSFAIASLRRSSYRWIARNNARKAASRGRNQYVCAMCPQDKIYKKNETQLDHIEPVIDVTKGWQGFDSFIDRLLCDETGYQVICKDHHIIKTAQEKELRMHYRKLLKEQK